MKWRFLKVCGVVCALQGLACGPPSKRGFPESARWAAYYGPASDIDTARLAADFQVLDIDADPTLGGWTVDQIASLKAGGRNRVLTYLSLGSCEQQRDYWARAPDGFIPCGLNTKAQLGPYAGFPEETWVNSADPDLQHLIVDFVAPRLLALGVDGLFLDNMDVVDRGDVLDARCDAVCAQGSLDLVRRLRERFPDALLVTNNGTTDVTRLGRSGGLTFPSLLDGVTHEGVFQPALDARVLGEMRAWRDLRLRPGGRQFLVASLDYVPSCDSPATSEVRDGCRREQFTCGVSDLTNNVSAVCWPP